MVVCLQKHTRSKFRNQDIQAHGRSGPDLNKIQMEIPGLIILMHNGGGVYLFMFHF